MWRRCRGQGLVEAAVALPILLLLVFGLIALAQLTQAQMGVSAVARESARTGALADSQSEAIARGEERGREVAAGYGMDDADLQIVVAVPEWSRGEEVVAEVRYSVSFDYLPLLDWTTIAVDASHGERVDLYRSMPGEENGE